MNRLTCKNQLHNMTQGTTSTVNVIVVIT